MIRRTAIVAAAAGLAVCLGGTAAFAAWTTTATGRGTAKAVTMPTGGTLIAPAAGNTNTSNATITVTWPAANYVGRTPVVAVPSYIVKRYIGAAGSQTADPTPLSAACGGASGIVSALTCTDTVTAAGTYSYSVTPLKQQATAAKNWVGTEGPISGTVTYTAVTVTGVSPTASAQGVTRAVTITGTGFASGATLSFPGTTGLSASGVTVVNATTITANFVATSSATLGARNVTVTVGANSATCTGCYTISAQPTISPNPTSFSIPHGGGTHTYAISGTGFQAGFSASVTDSTYVVTATSFTSTTSISVTVRNDYTDTSNHNANITITNPDLGSVTSGGNPVKNQ